MNKSVDIVRFTLLSPEVVVALLPLLAFYYCPSILDVLIKPMSEGIGFGLSAAALSLGMLAFNYKEGLDLLAPTGAKKILLDWPDYPQLKARVLGTFVWCICGAISSFLAVWMVATNNNSRLGVAILFSGLLVSAVATATMGLARFAIREVIGE